MRKSLILVGATFALAGCGGGSSSSSGETTTTAAPAAQGQTVTISETEYSLTPNKVQISKAGTVTFKVRNIGQIAHALEIEGNGVHQEIDALQPGSSTTLTVDLSKAGSYEMYCPIDGHKGKGMVGSVEVGGASAGGMTTTGSTTTTDDKGGGGYGH